MSQVVMGIYLFGLSVIDIQKRKIPVWILGVGTAATVMYRIWKRQNEMSFLLGMLVGIVFLGICKITKEALGYADGGLIVILGIYLGMRKVLYLLTISFFMAAVFSIVWLSMKKMNKKTTFAFIPFLTAGYIVTVIFMI